MIQSMTGFGRYELNEDGKKYIAEIKTVNHRYFDLNIKMPKKFNMFEAEIRNLLKEYIHRGKIDLYISYEDISESGTTIKYNYPLAAQYVQAIAEMSEKLNLTNDLTASKLSKYPDIFVMEEAQLNEEATVMQIKIVVTEAVKQLVSAREAEGKRLKSDLREKLNLLINEVEYIESRYPEIIKLYQEKLEQKVSEMLSDVSIEHSRILSEVTIYSDKICIDEELVRLKSHITSVIEALDDNQESVGRKLDFIVQEMNREANTILSKANNIDIADHGIILKTEIEKIREQVQNIE